MEALDKLRAADVAGALADLQAEIRRKPADAKLRVFLFQLLAVAGQWDRALTQLNVAGDLDASTLLMVQMYREAIGCEGVRRDVFAGKRAPLVLGEPQRWIALALESVRVAGSGSHEKAAELRAEAFDDAPTVSGTIDGAAFEWIADADTRVGPFLEAIVDGKYYWVPFHRIGRIAIEEPTDLRDIVWAPAQFTWANGGQSIGLIPARYTGTAEGADDQLRLARKTEWQEVSDGVFAGLGQRVLATDADEFSLLQVREIQMQSAGDTAPDG